MSSLPSEGQQGLRFRIVHEGGREEFVLVEASRALVGAAAHCDVRLIDDAAYEHIEVFCHDDFVYFATKPSGLSTDVPKLDGVPTTEGRWSANAAIHIGKAALYVELVRSAAPPPKRASPALVAASVGVCIAAIVVFFSTPDAGSSGGESEPQWPDAPALFTQREPRTCTDLGAEQRSVMATEQMRIALAKRERSPFFPRDGVDAVGHFERAAACFRAAGREDEALRAGQDAAALQAKLSEEYRLRRVRLEHAHRVHDASGVKREVPVLRSLLSGQPTRYTEWLEAIDRAATATLEQSKRQSQ